MESVLKTEFTAILLYSPEVNKWRFGPLLVEYWYFFANLLMNIEEITFMYFRSRQLWMWEIVCWLLVGAKIALPIFVIGNWTQLCANQKFKNNLLQTSIRWPKTREVKKGSFALSFYIENIVLRMKFFIYRRCFSVVSEMQQLGRGIVLLLWQKILWSFKYFNHICCPTIFD